MGYTPPFENGPLSEDPDEIAVLHQEVKQFLDATDEQVATDVALHQREQLKRKSFQEGMRDKLTSPANSNVVDSVRADKDNIFADELMLSMSVELPEKIRRIRKGY